MNCRFLVFVLFGALLLAVPSAPTQAKPAAKAKSRRASVVCQWPRTSRVHYDIDEVVALQNLLRYHGFFKSKPDGEFGPGTERAIKAFQKARGLKADGIAGPQTWEKLIVPLKRGARGDAVRAVQGVFGYGYSEGGSAIYNVKYDGVFGFETEKAVRHLQAHNKLSVDGIVARQTWCVLVGGKVTKP